MEIFWIHTPWEFGSLPTKITSRLADLLIVYWAIGFARSLNFPILAVQVFYRLIHVTNQRKANDCQSHNWTRSFFSVRVYNICVFSTMSNWAKTNNKLRFLGFLLVVQQCVYYYVNPSWGDAVLPYLSQSISYPLDWMDQLIPFCKFSQSVDSIAGL